MIVAIGISLIFKNRRKNEWEQFKKETEEAQKFTPTKTGTETGVETENPDSTTPTV